MRNKWTTEDNKFLKENYKKLSIKEIAVYLNKSEKSIQTKLGILKKYEFQNKKRPLVKTPANTSNWNNFQENFVKDNYDKMSCKEIGEKIGKTQNDVRQKILSFGLKIKRIKKEKQHSNWKEEEIQYLINNYENKTRLQLAEELNKTENIIRGKLIELNLTKTKKRGYHASWSDKEDLILINICKDKSINKNFKLLEIKKYLINRSELAIHRRIIQIGMKKYISKLETMPEKKIREILEKHNIIYKSQFKFPNTRYTIDFVIKENIAIEVQGDYWHCNPQIYINGPKDKIQKRKIETDKKKKAILEKEGYKVIYFWEFDIMHDLQKIENTILKL